MTNEHRVFYYVTPHMCLKQRIPMCRKRATGMFKLIMAIKPITALQSLLKKAARSYGCQRLESRNTRESRDELYSGPTSSVNYDMTVVKTKRGKDIPNVMMTAPANPFPSPPSIRPP